MPCQRASSSNVISMVSWVVGEMDRTGGHVVRVAIGSRLLVAHRAMQFTAG